MRTLIEEEKRGECSFTLPYCEKSFLPCSCWEGEAAAFARADEWKRCWRVAVSEQTQRPVVRGMAAASERDILRADRRRDGGWGMMREEEESREKKDRASGGEKRKGKRKIRERTQSGKK